ncbi:bifunctional (p)ppGpp synthetase/guanosine-3',5'-bis(diphosphate) 3'-pyrophosphohydrolase [Candidatus Woesearchaeota archaeon]|nr:bifunctional (p)ppGpp synthetase/guanosine-3',5'-bis(diphosphate) 3'-pyrophosphohydrolase [Candidatus Woesearchaeota archaeon]
MDTIIHKQYLQLTEQDREPHVDHGSFEDFIRKVLDYNPNADVPLIKKAFWFAHNSHEGQKRHSGEPYFTHPYGVADIMTHVKADSATICAALLHDCVEDCCTKLEDLRKEFGDEIAELVDGLTKIEGKFSTKEDYSAENVRKILIATAKDIRVMIIKLADRLHNMRTLGHLPADRQKRIAEETLNIYAPIAQKLGMREVKGELEDLSLKVLDHEAYMALRNTIAEKRQEREQRTREFIAAIKDALQKRGIEPKVEGRAKYFYSIYQKMKKQSKSFNEIYDLFAIRIIVNTVPECYTALGIIHELWRPVPGRFKDYISLPKANGYQSLHTSVMGTHGKIIEIQIRTQEMHDLAEEGIAAHWRYKGTERDKRFDRKMSWLKQILEWKATSSTAKEFVETLKVDLFENEIVVFTPKGDPISLPEGSTPVDFAYAVHTNLGNQASKALVNGKIVPLDATLKSGDIITIHTQNNAVPSRNWLSFVKTSKAKSKIKSALNIHISDAHHDFVALAPAALLDKIEVLGKHAPLKFSKCCNPAYKDQIIAFFTKDKKITVHKKDCPNLSTLEDNRAADVRWKEDRGSIEIKMKVVVKDRVGLLAELLTLLSQSRVNVKSINTRTKKDRINITFSLQPLGNVNYTTIVNQIRGIRDVIDVKW